MGHNFGMSHDFDAKHGGDASPCNHQGIMSYGDKLNQWSTCSVNDFTGYYNSKKWGSTCLKGKYLSNSFKSFSFNIISIYLNIVIQCLIQYID